MPEEPNSSTREWQKLPIRVGLACKHTPLSALLLQEPRDGALAAGDLIAGTVALCWRTRDTVAPPSF